MSDCLISNSLYRNKKAYKNNKNMIIKKDENYLMKKQGKILILFLKFLKQINIIKKNYAKVIL